MINSSGQADCSICIEVLSPQTEPFKVVGVANSCRHAFHYNCLFRNMEIRDTCPLCRRVISSIDLELTVKHLNGLLETTL